MVMMMEGDDDGVDGDDDGDDRDDGDGDSLGTGTLDEAEVLVVVVEELCNGILCTSLYLLLQPIDIHVHIGRLLVLLGVAGYAIREGLTRLLDGRAIAEESFVEAVDLRLQLYGMAVATGRGGEDTFVLGLIATQEQQVGDAEKLEVEQYVFGLLTGEAATEDMGHYVDVVLVLDSGGHGDGTRATT